MVRTYKTNESNGKEPITKTTFLSSLQQFYPNGVDVIVDSVSSVFGIYVVCTIIDQIRIFYIERPLFKWLDKYYKLTR